MTPENARLERIAAETAENYRSMNSTLEGAILQALNEAVEPYPAMESQFREFLFKAHATYCGTGPLCDYCDDGERQCSELGIDFKRDGLTNIVEKLESKRYDRVIVPSMQQYQREQDLQKQLAQSQERVAQLKEALTLTLLYDERESLNDWKNNDERNAFIELMLLSQVQALTPKQSGEADGEGK